MPPDPSSNPASISASIPEPVRTICRVLHERGERGWVVGGCIRDLLRGAPVSDWDVATSATPQEVRAFFRRVIPTGLQHGTVTVVLDGEGYEVTTLRGEGAYSDGRRPDEVFFVRDIREDLARRDFTINALAFDPIAEELTDPFGGSADMDRGLVRCVGDARERFSEDGLRVLRAARFSATLEFALEPETEAAIRPSLPTFRKVSKERIREEWVKAMKARRPSIAFRVMQRTGILESVAPGLEELIGFEPARGHDAFERALLGIDAVSGSPVRRLAMLFLDVGGPLGTDDASRDRAGADHTDAWFKEHRFSNDERKLAVDLVRHHRIDLDDASTDADLRRWVRRVGEHRVADLLPVRTAELEARDDPARIAQLERTSERLHALVRDGFPQSVRDLAVTGGDVLARVPKPPGRWLRAVLEALLEEVTDDPTLNTKEKLLDRSMLDRALGSTGDSTELS
ncbi:MAG: hypothetical protein AAGF12_10890 [Myxococcota bacterium]